MAKPSKESLETAVIPVMADLANSTPPELYEGADFKHQEKPNLTTNESDLKLHLQFYEESLRKKGNFRTYFGELLTVIVALTTSNTKDMFYLPGAAWTALFVFVGGYCAFKLARGLLDSLSFSDAIRSGSLRQLIKRDTGTIDSVIEEIKRSSFRMPRARGRS